MECVSRLQQELSEKSFVFTVELSPPKGAEYVQVLAAAEKIAGRVTAFNITDNQRSVMRMAPLAICRLLHEAGHEAVLQVTCRDRNILGLQADVLGAYGLGIRNILALTGDHPVHGDHPFAKPVFDADSVQLLHIIKQVLETGKDLSGANLQGVPKYFVGAVANPGGLPRELHLLKVRKKISQGAQFIQTQAVFDVTQFGSFLEEFNPEVPVLVGIFPLKSAKMACFLQKNVPGVSIPDAVLQRMEDASDPYQEGIRIAAETIEAVRDRCAGVHLMTMGDVNTAQAILDRLCIDK